MIFDRFFKKNAVPTKQGKNLTQSYFLEFPSVPGNPLFELKTELVIGSEVGEAKVVAPDISPRHATFRLSGDAVSVVDHNSIQGTFINNVQLESGKEYFINPSDQLRMGRIPFHLKMEEVKMPEPEPEPMAKPIPIRPDVKVPPAKATVVKPKSKLKFLTAGSKDEATTSSLPRLLALISDACLTLGVINIFGPFVEFSDFMKAWMGLLKTSLTPLVQILMEQLQPILDQKPDIKQAYQDLLNYVQDQPMWLEAAAFFVLFRLVSTLVFGVSLSQACMGLRGASHPIWNRIGGFLREILGLLLGPLFIFDLPTLIGFRSFKEVITFTKISTWNKWITSILTLLFFAFSLAFYITSPLMKAMEPAPLITFTEEKNTEKAADVLFHSQYWNLSLAPHEDYILFPNFNYKIKNGVLSFNPELLMYQKSTKHTVHFALKSEFSMSQLFHPLFINNPQAEKQYPMLASVAFHSKNVSSAFQLKIKEEQNTKYYAELKELLTSYKDFKFESIHLFVLKEGPILKGYRDFAERLQSLIGPEAKLSLSQVGNFPFLKITNASEIRLIPLSLNGYQYVISSKVQGDADKMLKDVLARSRWFKEVLNVDTLEGQKNDINVMEMIDSLAHPEMPEVRKNQLLSLYFGFYYSLAQTVLKTKEPVLTEIYTKQLEAFINLMKAVAQERSKTSQDNQIIDQLILKLDEMKAAFINQEMPYFGLEIEI